MINSTWFFFNSNILKLENRNPNIIDISSYVRNK